MLVSINSVAQINGDWIESGQLKLRVNSDGAMATFNNGAASELISGSNNHLFKFINLWISGYYNSTELHITSVNGFNNTTDYSPGPIDSLKFEGADPAAWNKVWSVTANDISEHKRNFKNTNYTVIDAIKNWPSNGTDKFYKYLAPFIDYDNNGIYEPANGDYPEIIGDKASYFIVNDNYSEHKASGGQPLKVEIYGMAYTLAGMPNTVFAKYFIINRTDKDYTNLKVSFHTGFQLGNDQDNYCGTIVPENMIFSYNGDADDDNHFGTNKPLAAFMVLNKNISSTLYLNKDTSIETGLPLLIPIQYRNLMEGEWKSSKKLTFGNDGTGNTASANFVYPAYTDPSFPTQNWVENQTPGERSMLTNLSYTNLNSKGYIELDLAITGFEKSTGDPYLFLATKAKEIKSAWAKQVASISNKKQLERVIQNPVSQGENFYKPWFSNYENIIIYNTMGQIIEKINPKVDNTLTIESKGMYFIEFIIDNQNFTKRILIF